MAEPVNTTTTTTTTTDTIATTITTTTTAITATTTTISENPLSTAQQEVSTRFAELFSEEGKVPDRRGAMMAYHAATGALEGLRQHTRAQLASDAEAPPSEEDHDGKAEPSNDSNTNPNQDTACDCAKGCQSPLCPCIRAGDRCTIQCRRGVHHQCWNMAQPGDCYFSAAAAAHHTHAPVGRRKPSRCSLKRRSAEIASPGEAAAAGEGDPLTPTKPAAASPRKRKQSSSSSSRALEREERKEKIRVQGQRATVRSQAGLKTYSWMKTVEEEA